MHYALRSHGTGFARAVLGFMAAALTYSLPQPAHAQTVYVAGSSNEFGTLNLATGQFTQTGTLASTLFGLGFTSGGTLYGVDSMSQLYQVDPVTGVETLEGHIGPDAAFTATASGELLYGLTGASSAVFFSISPTTQTATELATDTGITSDGLFASSGGTLYATGMSSTGISTLYRLTTSGVVTALGSTGIMDTNEAFGAGVFAGNTLYGFNNNRGIYTFDTGTGAATLTRPYDLGTSGDTLYAAALAPAAAPEPATPATLILGILGLGALSFNVRHRKTSA